MISFILQLIFITLTLYVRGKEIVMVDNYNKYFFYLILGYLLSPLVLILTYSITFLSKPKIGFSINIEWNILLSVVWEEIIWRIYFISFFLQGKKDYLEKIIFILIVTILFVISHSQDKLKDYRDVLEMFLYSLLLMITAIIWPGMNIGLHLGRNTICKKAKDEWDERN